LVELQRLVQHLSLSFSKYLCYFSSSRPLKAYHSLQDRNITLPGCDQTLRNPPSPPALSKRDEALEVPHGMDQDVWARNTAWVLGTAFATLLFILMTAKRQVQAALPVAIAGIATMCVLLTAPSDDASRTQIAVWGLGSVMATTAIKDMFRNPANWKPKSREE
jgi:hypothetical protein